MKRITGAPCAIFTSAASFLRRLPLCIVHYALCIGLLAATAWAQEPQEEPQEPAIPRPNSSYTEVEFARGVKFTVAGYNGGAEVQTNFPVLVRLSTSITGFDYNDFYNKNAADLSLIDIGFVDAEGNGLSYEIDTWDTSGESLVWVNLPVMTNGTEFAMWYRSSKTGKDLNPTNAWTEYAGVWHFSEDYGTETGSVNVYDSTTNELTGATYWSSSNPNCKSSSYTTDKRVGRARKIATTSGTKGVGAITVSLGTTDSPKRKAVDKLGSEFSVSFWLRRESQQYNYIIGRKDGDDYGSWAFQQHVNATRHRIYSNGTDGKENTGYAQADGVNTLNKWVKYDLVYTSDGKFSLYCDGSNKADKQSLIPGSVTQGNLDLYIGGGKDGGNCRPVVGAMDEVRLCYKVPTAERVKADYDTVNTAAFLTAGTVVTNNIIERPVVNFTVADVGASHIQFGGTLSSLGASEATECTFYAKVWPTASAEPETWTAFASNLTVGAFSGLDKGLIPATAYSYALMISNDVEALSYETRDSFTTSGVGVSGTGGDVTRVGDDWIHYFRVALDDEDVVTNTYTFTPPSYATSVRALVVAGGGPGGYKAGGGGGAGGLIYNAALGVTGGNPYTITVGEGGAASGSAEIFGTSGGNSSITNKATGADVLTAIGGGAGGNYSNNSNYRVGRDGGSGGGSPHVNANAGLGTQGQGNDGGKGNSNRLAGGGGGAGTEGAAAPSTGNNQNAGAGGAGLECDITGVGVYYAGGGGGGGEQYSGASGSPGAGGNGGGGTGSRKDANGTASAATAGVDGLGGGGGGGCGDVEALYKGGDGGDGIVIIRYASQGDFTAIAEPIISLQSAVCNDDAFTGDVAFRVAWAGYGHDDVAQVKAVWGYAKTALTHTNDIATAVIGLGTGSFPLKADKRTVYLKLLAVNAAGEEAYSSEMLSFYVNENGQAVEDDDLPILENVALEADVVWAKVSGEVVSAGQASGSPKTCTVRVRYGTAAAALTSVVTASDVAVGDVTIAVNGLSPNTTYYYAVEIEDDAGTVITEDTASFTTLQQPTFAAVTTEVNETTLSLSGGLSVAGGGVTTVFVTWGDAAPVIAATFDKDSVTTAFASTNRMSAWAESVAWKVVYSNELTNADGTGNGTVKTKEYSGVLVPVDKATYTWQAVDGEWNGDWTNAAHWASDKAVCRGYPDSANAEVDFPNGTVAIVSVPGKYRYGSWSVSRSNLDVTFVGNGADVSSLGSTSDNMTGGSWQNCSWTFSNLTLIEKDGVNFGESSKPTQSRNSTFRFTDGADVSFGNGIAPSGSNMWFVVESGAVLSFRSGGGISFVTKDGGIRLDGGTINASRIYTDYGWDATTNQAIIVSGVSPRINLTESFRNSSADAKNLQNSDSYFNFSVPVAAWSEAPIYSETATEQFAALVGDGGGKYVFSIDNNSPLISAGVTRLVPLVAWSGGIVTNNVVFDNSTKGVEFVLTYGWPSKLPEPENDGDAPTGISARVRGRSATIMIVL